MVTQRAEEQMFHYDCIGKDLSDIPVWDSSNPSPPTSVTAPSKSEEPKETISTSERRATGQNKTLRFAKGEAVYGWRIELDTGKVCDGGGCYLPVAPGPGEVTSGVVNPWPTEVEGVTPWDPN
ncbi:hypothetical protein KKI19_02185 [Patescibacteria group bacterium]|nr:hypothetical protein [Patescibacteria group bacterium]